MRWPVSDFEISHRWVNPLSMAVTFAAGAVVGANVHIWGNTLALPFLVAFIYFWARWDRVRAFRRSRLLARVKYGDER